MKTNQIINSTIRLLDHIVKSTDLPCRVMFKHEQYPEIIWIALAFDPPVFREGGQLMVKSLAPTNPTNIKPFCDDLIKKFIDEYERFKNGKLK